MKTKPKAAQPVKLASQTGPTALKVDRSTRPRKAGAGLTLVASKYVGETEKNLSATFAATGRAGKTLLFDEADVLLGKRTAVRDANDRYANLEASASQRRAPKPKKSVGKKL